MKCKYIIKVLHFHGDKCISNRFKKLFLILVCNEICVFVD